MNQFDHVALPAKNFTMLPLIFVPVSMLFPLLGRPFLLESAGKTITYSLRPYPTVNHLCETPMLPGSVSQLSFGESEASCTCLI